MVGLYLRPLPQIQPVNTDITLPKSTAVELAWPSSGQAAFGALGYGLLEAHNNTAPQSIASVAKVITALAVLQQKPLISASQGPIITLDATDVGYYNYYATNDGSVVKVSQGEQISEYQALQAMLIASSNNLADSLTRWAFGSLAAYTTYANQMVGGLGLTHTTVGDTNGFDDTTTSTADDLVKLGLKAIQDPVISDIVNQPTATIPIAGQIKNVNWLLGSDGVMGIKTGNTDKAGGCYLFAAKRVVEGSKVTMVGAVLGTPSLSAAISAAPPLLIAADSGFQQQKVISKDQVVATYHAPWGASAQAKSTKDVSQLAWKGNELKLSNNLQSIRAPVAYNSTLGSVTISSGNQSTNSRLFLTPALPGPSWHWRIFHR